MKSSVKAKCDLDGGENAGEGRGADSSPREEFRKGQVRKFVWKNVEMYRFADKLLAVALAKPADDPWFGADEVVDPEFTYDPRTAGCVINAIKEARLIESCMIQVDEKRGILMGRRLAKKDSRNSARVQLWQLTSRTMALKWRRENADMAASDPRNPELFNGVPRESRTRDNVVMGNIEHRTSNAERRTEQVDVPEHLNPDKVPFAAAASREPPNTLRPPVMAPTPAVVYPSNELPLGLPRPIVGAGTD